MRSPSTVRGRVVLAKAGLDAHERGVHVVAHGLRDSGFEVIYLGLRRTPQEIVAAAIQEDADAIGLSSLAGGHLRFSRLLLDELDSVDSPPLLVVGGLIEPADEKKMLEGGVHAVFNVETPIAAIVDQLADSIAKRREELDV
jgi:methylmalonyl-CoA mutase C-terminal domain/subunit